MDVSVGSDAGSAVALMRNLERGEWGFTWSCRKWSEEACDYVRDKLNLPKNTPVSSPMLESFMSPEEIVVVEGNLLLNEGIQELWDLAIGAGGTTAYNNANAEIGVGDSATAAVATHTDLQAASNKLYKAMVATYPIRTNQSVEWRSDFLTAEANWAWAEWSIRNGVTRNKNLNRKVEALGTKTTGTWTMSGTATLT
ncbi:MAG: hypothetical protein ABWY20_07905 [Mycobacterium sp.]